MIYNLDLQIIFYSLSTLKHYSNIKIPNDLQFGFAHDLLYIIHIKTLFEP